MFKNLCIHITAVTVVFHFSGGAAFAWGAPAEDDALVSGILARASALVSGRIDYHLITGFQGKAKTIHDGDYKFSLMGGSWARRSPHSTGFRINHLGMELLYLEGLPINGGEPYRTAMVSNIEAIDRHRPCPPFFAGTLWHKESAKYLETHRGQEVRRSGEPRDGKLTEVVEWQVDKQDLRAFRGATDAMRNGGILRLHAAPELGYALPLIEYLAPDGAPQKIFESSDFFEAASGLFLPRRCESRSVSTAAGYYCKYRITKAELINEELPEDDFKCDLLPGTVVSDTRTPGHKTVFRVGEIPLIPDDLADIIETSGRRRAPWLRAAAVGICVGLAFVAVLTLIRRLRAARSSL